MPEGSGTVARGVLLRVAAGVLLGLAALWGAFTLAQWAAHTFAGGEALRFPWEAFRHMVVRGGNPYARWRLLYAWHGQHGGEVVPQVYPFHLAVVFFLPLTRMRDFATARAVAMTGVWLAWALTAWRTARAFGWRGGKLLAAAVFLFALTWFFTLEALLRGDVVALALALGMAALAALVRRQDGVAGGLLALTLIKPAVALPAVAFLLLWSASQRRWRLWGGFWGVTAVLMGISLWLLPSWPLDAARLAVQFPGRHAVRDLFAAAMPGIGRQLGWLITALVVGMVLAEWVVAWGKPPARAVWTTALTLWGALWWSSRVTVADQVVLLVPLAVVWLHWSGRWKTYGRPAVWASLLAFWGVSWALWWPRGWAVAALASALPVHVVAPVLVWPLLYTVRWWATRTHVVWEDTLPLELL